MTTRVSATSLDVRPKDYGLDWMIDLRFIMVNVADLYTLYKDAIKHNYELFEENVREFLGTQGINNGIIKTLQSPTDRENFFYYNNGITLICEKCETLRGSEHLHPSHAAFQSGKLPALHSSQYAVSSPGCKYLPGEDYPAAGS